MTTSVVTNCNTEEVLEFAIKASAFIGPDLILTDSTVYYLKGRILALNHDDLQYLISPSESFRSELANKVSMTGLGLTTLQEVENVTGINITTGHELGQTSALPNSCIFWYSGCFVSGGGVKKNNVPLPTNSGDVINHANASPSKGKGKASLVAIAARPAGKRSKPNGSDVE
ncbi:uncharacterized protein MELLADRAFT_105112 [Melampsora larici-populina 98AG31]|uniref:Uncharacterized protein n=1 Tax=Melampsora larici-populina (strain 98AG31 / pathotype 3-4-7) TaxID=747676 RepID=F4RHG0_MELLP|nr:uncharacterized protein MELLADRAFT_105112 [Melampsora larici-populina 98AG31]EGG08361.1 hypothetical protein MELLADRAFT_105112 [Melampsora larici-populina 98AG31]